MSIEKVLTKLEISDSLEILKPFWKQSLESYAPIEILTNESALRDIAEDCGLTENEILKSINCAKIISESEDLSFIFHHIFRLIFETPEYENKNFNNFPMIPQLGEKAGVFYLLIVLTISCEIRNFYKDKNIPEEISKETLHDVKININRYARANNGNTGIMPGVLGWFKTHNTRTLYRIGRLQFHYKEFGDDVVVYRNKKNNEIVVLSKANINYTKNGFWAVDGKEDKLPDNWISGFEDNEKNVTGNPINPNGQAEKKCITLDKENWELELSKGRGVLDIHIPEGGGMTVESCILSMKESLNFFKEYFPEFKPVAFVCRSWIFSPQYDEIYRSDANFVLFQKEVFLFPVWSSGKEGLFFVFDTEDIDYDSVETRSSLQRAMVSHLKGGGVLRAGGMIYLCKDIEFIGQRYYLKHN